MTHVPGDHQVFIGPHHAHQDSAVIAGDDRCVSVIAFSVQFETEELEIVTDTFANRGSPPTPDDAQLLEWELVLPSIADVTAVGESLRAAGHCTGHDAHGFVTADPWHTRMRILANE
jgi:hypothetical protein